MKKYDFKKIVTQIKKYELSDSFSSIEELEKWIFTLNSVQANNFINLDMDSEQIKNFKDVLINKNLLNCKDYKQKISAITKLKNVEGCCHLLKDICNPNFLKSKNFYKDIEMLSKADTARYGLWILGEDSFIKSPYHEEDLKLLIETHDTNKDKPLDFVVSDAIATVASDINSIKSPYHRLDMKLIASSGSECLQMSHSYPEHSLNNLAVDEVSLSDKYHLENMQILANKQEYSTFLYEIMTDPYFVKGKNYRAEIEALINAKSKVTARALYYYIVNPERKYLSDMDYIEDCDYNVDDVHISDRNSVAGRNDLDYLQNLKRINKIDDKFVMYYVSLLMQLNFIHSEYKKFDLALLEKVSDKNIFMDLYQLMMNRYSLFSKYHKEDAVIISQTKKEDIRKLLLKLATNVCNVKSDNHKFDMEYILKLDLNNLDEAILKEINYYLFMQKGIEDSKHKEKLEKLLQGILVERSSSVSSYLDALESKLDNYKDDDIKTSKSKIFSLLRKK